MFMLFLVLSCKQNKKYHDEAQNDVEFVQTDALKDVIDFHKKMNEDFKDPESSPLPDKYRKNFEALDFFPPDTNYIVRAKLVRTPEAVPFLMPTTTDRKSEETVYGIAHFTLHGKSYQLEIYQNK